MKFSWEKAHIGIQGNETAGRLAKEAAGSRNLVECYSKLAESVIPVNLNLKVNKSGAESGTLQLKV